MFISYILFWGGGDSPASEFCADVSEHCSVSIGRVILVHTPMKMEHCSETSEHKIQTPGNHPEESIQHSEHGDSLKSRIHIYCLSENECALQLRKYF